MTAEPEHRREALRRKRALSTPGSRKAARTDSGPDPWAALAPLGDRAHRTATALAELAVETCHLPETWLAQNAIAEAATHEILAAQQIGWRNGIAHGKWLATQEDDNYMALQAKLSDLQQRYNEAMLLVTLLCVPHISNGASN